MISVCVCHLFFLDTMFLLLFFFEVFHLDELVQLVLPLGSLSVSLCLFFVLGSAILGNRETEKKTIQKTRSSWYFSSRPCCATIMYLRAYSSSSSSLCSHKFDRCRLCKSLYARWPLWDRSTHWLMMGAADHWWRAPRNLHLPSWFVVSHFSPSLQTPNR